jgi:hypothetical protein
MIRLCISFQMSSYTGSFIISVKLNGKENIHMAKMLVFYILQKNYLNKNCMFFNDLLPYIISGPYGKWH